VNLEAKLVIKLSRMADSRDVILLRVFSQLITLVLNVIYAVEDPDQV